MGGEFKMSGKQETLIYIEKENKAEAEFMSQSFVNEGLKNRAYINALGAELAMKYLQSEGINVSDIYNMHSISKILEKFDISDILLPNIHIDVRVVFDENQIFIPKSHFALEITPDIYMVLKLSLDFKYVELLGYFEPKSVNLKNCNAEYYFFEKDKLSSVDTLKQFISKFNGNTSKGISQEEMYKGRELSISMADHNISESEQKELFKLLLASDALRESVLEFDNFETLSYSVGSASYLTEPEKDTPTIAPISEDDTIAGEDEPSADEDETQAEENQEQAEDEEMIIDESEDVPVINIEQDVLTLEEPEAVSETEIPEEETPVADSPEVNGENDEDMSVVDGLDLDTGLDFGEDLVLDDNIEFESLDTSCVETSLTETVDFEEIISDSQEVAETQEKSSQDSVVPDILKTAAGAAAAAGTIAATAAAAETMAAAGASGEAMKLAGIAGDIVNDLVDKNLESQQTSLNKIDYAKTTHGASTDEIPENVAAFDLSSAKLEANLEAEMSGQSDVPTDLSELKTVETENLGYGEIVQETVDLSEMSTVETDEIKEDIEDIVNLNTLSSIDSPTKPADNIEDKMVDDDSQYLGMELPNMSTYTINADGSSALDNLDIQLEQENEEHLVDFNMNANEFNLDNLESLDMNNNIEEYPQEMITFKNNYDLNLTSEDNTIAQKDNSLPDENLPVNFEEDNTLDDSSEATIEELLGDTLLSEDDNSEQDNSLINEPEQFENSQSLEEESIPDDSEIVYGDEVSSDDFFNEIEQVDSNPEIQDIDTLPEDIVEEAGYDEVEINENPENLIEEDIVPDNSVSEVEVAENPEEILEAQDWLDDTNYDNLPDAEIPQPEEPITESDFITEPTLGAEQTFAVTENSRVISDKNFMIGEIPIDINNNVTPELEGPEQLGQLYNQNNQNNEILQTPGTLTSRKQQGGKAGLGVGLGIVGVLLALIIVGVIGFTVSKMIKQPAEEVPQPITDDNVPTTSDNGVTDVNTLNVNPDNVVNMDNTNTTPALPAPKKVTAGNVKQVQPVAAVGSQNKKTMPETSFIEVKKLTWEVPDYISYNQNFKQYFQAVGKSLKLSLTSDLLLATEYVYSDQVRVTITFDKDGTLKNTRILLSSGSSQVDNIVLQTVNQTLKVLKAPHSVGNDESTTVILKIYF